jgi:hypothetical protein
VVGYVILVGVLVVVLAMPTRLHPAVRGWLGRIRTLVRGRLAVVEQPTAKPAESAEVDILLYSLELRRLAEQVQQARMDNRPGRMVHITATEAAYDTVLLSCCRSAGLDAPDRRPPLLAEERMEAELALMTHGVSW